MLRDSFPYFLAQTILSCLRNPSGSEIRSVAVWMSERLEQCKEVVEVMTRKVVEFLETNMGMVEDNLGQVGNNLEEAWGNLVEEYFSGDNVPALQVNCPNPKTFKTHLHTEDSPSRYPHHHQPHCQHHPNLWYCVQGHRRRHHPPHQPAQLATGSTTALQTTPINEMLSFYFSKKNYSQSQGSRREREFSSLNLRVRDENEIFFSTSQGSRRERDFFLNISGFETRARFFLSTSQGSRREWDIFFQSLMFRDGNEICKLISRGRARKNEPNSHENSRDREFSLCSGLNIWWNEV